MSGYYYSAYNGFGGGKKFSHFVLRTRGQSFPAASGFRVFRLHPVCSVPVRAFLGKTPHGAITQESADGNALLRAHYKLQHRKHYWIRFPEGGNLNSTAAGKPLCGYGFPLVNSHSPKSVISRFYSTGSLPVKVLFDWDRQAPTAIKGLRLNSGTASRIKGLRLNSGTA